MWIKILGKSINLDKVLYYIQTTSPYRNGYGDIEAIYGIDLFFSYGDEKCVKISIPFSNAYQCKMIVKNLEKLTGLINIDNELGIAEPA